MLRLRPQGRRHQKVLFMLLQALSANVLCVTSLKTLGIRLRIFEEHSILQV